MIIGCPVPPKVFHQLFSKHRWLCIESNVRFSGGERAHKRKTSASRKPSNLPPKALSLAFVVGEFRELNWKGWLVEGLNYRCVAVAGSDMSAGNTGSEHEH
jgi:hypothetical protein